MSSVCREGRSQNFQRKIQSIQTRFLIRLYVYSTQILSVTYIGMLEQKLTAERKKLSRRYSTLKDEVKEAAQIRKGVYSILREENRKEQPAHKQDLER